jgi:hypothetical protein
MRLPSFCQRSSVLSKVNIKSASARKPRAEAPPPCRLPKRSHSRPMHAPKPERRGGLGILSEPGCRRACLPSQTRSTDTEGRTLRHPFVNTVCFRALLSLV